MPQVVVLAFTDPMLALSYEQEPVLRQLETHYGASLVLRSAMRVYIDDVLRLCRADELALGEEAALEAVLARLAKEFEAAEAVSGMPVAVPRLRLFDKAHTSSRPLCLAYKAVQQVAPERAEAFLYALRYATIVALRPTTHRSELLHMAREAGVDEAAFARAFDGDDVQRALAHDAVLARTFGVQQLPTYLVQCGLRRVLVRGVAAFEVFAEAIRQVTDGRLLPSPPAPTTEALRRLVARHPLLSPIEVSHAFALHHPAAVRSFIQPLVDSGELEELPVPHGLFLRRRD